MFLGRNATVRAQSSDTSPEAEAVLIDLLRAVPPWRKMAMVEDSSWAVRCLGLAGLAKRHPGASPEELRRRLAGLIFGETLAEKAYGPLVTAADLTQ